MFSRRSRTRRPPCRSSCISSPPPPSLPRRRFCAAFFAAPPLLRCVLSRCPRAAAAPVAAGPPPPSSSSCTGKSPAARRGRLMTCGGPQGKIRVCEGTTRVYGHVHCFKGGEDIACRRPAREAPPPPSGSWRDTVFENKGSGSTIERQCLTVACTPFRATCWPVSRCSTTWSKHTLGQSWGRS